MGPSKTSPIMQLLRDLLCNKTLRGGYVGEGVDSKKKIFFPELFQSLCLAEPYQDTI